MNKQYFFVWEPDTQKEKPVYNALVKAVNDRKLSDRMEVIRSPFIGFTTDGPIMRVMPDNAVYTKFKDTDVESIVNAHLSWNRGDKFANTYENKLVPVPERDAASKQF